MTVVKLVFFYVIKEAKMVINTPKTRLEKISWLNNQEDLANFSKLQLQKFLFFYEMFQFAESKAFDFSSLKAYKNGPVFSNFYGDITYREDEVKNYLEQNREDIKIDINNAKSSMFLINTMTDSELSSLTHEFDFWNIHKDRIEAQEKQIDMEQEDITKSDIDILRLIKNSEPNYDYEILKLGEKRFVFSKDDFSLLSDDHLELLDSLSGNEELINPVFVELDTEGRLLID